MRLKHLLRLAILAATVTAQATTIGDTVKVINNPGKVVITESAGKVKVNVVGSPKDADYNYTYQLKQDKNGHITTSQTEGKNIHFNLPFSKSDTATCGKGFRHWECFISGLYFGFGNSSLKNGGEVKMNYLSEVGLLNLIGIGYKPNPTTRISLGVGFGKRNYYVKTPYAFAAADGYTIIGKLVNETGSRVSGVSSKVGVVQMHIPLMLRQQIGKCFITVGGIMNWNMHADIEQRYKIDNANERHHVVTNKLTQRKINVDIIAGFGYRAIGVYGRYQPASVFKKDYGPDIKSGWSIGLMLAF